MSTPLEFTADPSILVFAIRHVLPRRGSHAATVVAHAVRRNVHLLPAPARQAIVRDVTGWLDGPGADADLVDREPWVQALAVLGVARSLLPASVLEELPELPRRRRADRATA